MFKIAISILLFSISISCFAEDKEVSERMLIRCNINTSSDVPTPSYAQSIFDKVKVTAGLDRQVWLKISNDVEINAWACPNNLIVISQNMLIFVEGNNGALATIIGHEMSHVTFGHNRVSKPISANEAQGFELKADVNGMKLANKAGYDGCKYADYLRKLMYTFGDMGGGDSDHPLTSERIKLVKCSDK